MNTLMKINKTNFDGLFVVKTEPFADNRGSFARLFCENELKPIIGDRKILQINHSKTNVIGAVRGLHYQKPPFAEMKLIRCIKGRVFDVVVDLRKNSKTFLKYHAEELSPENNNMLVVPEGFAHGFQVLEENSEMLYLHTALYNKDFEAGIRYDDPEIAIKWQKEVRDLSVRDANHPLINDFEGIEI